jgi:hypothetical protein
LPSDASEEEVKGHGRAFPTKLRTVALNFQKEVVDAGYDYFACVLNTDTYAGNGQHWVALLVDVKNKKIEYFDSVGEPPFADVVDWGPEVRSSVSNHGTNMKLWNEWTPFREGNSYRHQNENYDCGVFALYYIISRIRDKLSSDSFLVPSKNLTDEYMRNTFRSQMFRKADF